MTPLDKLLLEELPTVTLTGTIGGPGAADPPRRGARENPPPDPDAALHYRLLSEAVSPTTKRKTAKAAPKRRHLHAVPPPAA